MPTEEIAESHQEGHDPEQVEKVLSQVETDAKPMIDRLCEGIFPPSTEERYRLSMFAALQLTRGWRFRRDMDDLASIAARMHLEQLDNLDERIVTFLRRRGDPATTAAVGEFRERVLAEDAFKLRMGQTFGVQQSLRFAFSDFQRRIYTRTWRLLRFNEPSLLTSDSPPVGLWAPDDESVGVANATAIFLPLDRWTALAFVQRGGGGHLHGELHAGSADQPRARVRGGLPLDLSPPGGRSASRHRAARTLRFRRRDGDRSTRGRWGRARAAPLGEATPEVKDPHPRPPPPRGIAEELVATTAQARLVRSDDLLNHRWPPT